MPQQGPSDDWASSDAPDTPVSVKKVGLVGCITSFVAVAPMGVLFLFLFVLFAFPKFQIQTCGIGEPAETALGMVEECPETWNLIGEDPQLVWGLGCGNFEIDGHSGYADESVPIEGSRGRGQLYFYASRAHRSWRLHSAELEIEGRTYDLIQCSTKQKIKSAMQPGDSKKKKKKKEGGSSGGLTPEQLEKLEGVLEPEQLKKIQDLERLRKAVEANQKTERDKK